MSPPLDAGLVPSSADEPIEVELLDHEPGEDHQVTDDQGNILRLEHADGTITVSLDGAPLARLNDNPNPPKWFDNLVEHIDTMQLGIICDDLIRGVEEDIDSREEWMEQHVEALKMLGWKLEVPNQTSDSADG